jgi:hypothetical protein
LFQFALFSATHNLTAQLISLVPPSPRHHDAILKLAPRTVRLNAWSGRSPPAPGIDSTEPRPLAYDHMRVFGYLCYPNTTATLLSNWALALRAVACVFLGIAKGIGCLLDPWVRSGLCICTRHPSMQTFYRWNKARCTTRTPHGIIGSSDVS